MFRRIVRTAVLALGITGAGFAVAPTAGATTFLPLSLENLADVSTMVVEGQVREVYTEVEEGGVVWTRVRVVVTDVWKGHAVERELLVSSAGGAVGTYRTHVPGMAVFSEGEDVLLFLHRDNHDRLIPVGKYLGKMTIRRAPGDVRSHVMRWHDRPEWAFDHRFLPHPAPADRTYLEDLENQLRAQLAQPWDGHEIPGVDPEFLARVNTPEIRSAR